MTLTRRDIAGLSIVVAMAVAGVALRQQLPAEMAIHFGTSGQPDSFVATPLGLALLPALGVGVVVLFRVIPAIDPLGANIDSFRRYYDALAVLTVAILAYVHGLLLAYNVGYRFPVEQAIVPVLVVAYLMAGYVIENAEQNWFVGIRTPWTLSDEEVWKRTHERTAILFKLSGVVALGALVLPQYFELLAIVPVAATALLATVYSFVLYRRRDRKHGH